MIRNPILPGFEPDPSILRVGDDYYIATSTFEWWPGVRVHHSRDLVHWRPIGGILDEPRLLDLSGVPDSGGVWAPCLTHDGERFHLVYGVVDGYSGASKDVRNYAITATDVTGPWSDPVELHGRGFDASLFHDNGTSWLLNMICEPWPGSAFAGIEIQQYEGGRLLGEPRTIFSGTSAGLTEGPHLYRRDGWYYLMTAEGGTGYDHQVTVARSRDLFGPYEPDPAGPMLTARHDPGLELQKAGHGCLVETQDGAWYLTHLTGRPYTPRGRCVLGRETAIQRVEWSDGWPRVGGGVPAEKVAAPELTPHPWPPAADDFAGPGLGPDWSTLRRPPSAGWLTLDGRLRLAGGQSPGSTREPSLVARRVTARRCSLETSMDFTPGNSFQRAGVTAFYNSRNWHYLAMTDEGLVLATFDRGRRTVHLRIPASGPVGLRVELDGPVARFAYDLGEGWRTAPVELDATILSDEHGNERDRDPDGPLAFTGAFLGLWAQDLSREGRRAVFSHADYRTG